MANKKKHALPCNEQEQPTRHRTASALYFITGLGALTTAVGMMMCGKRSRALLIAQWVAPLLITAASERLSCRKKQNSDQ
ncbi:MAG: hypothetical protein K2G58_06040 [Alistipes sp.]|nr:hypothetical protein [Alistipes sp.]